MGTNSNKALFVFCDGTWNTPDHRDRGIPAPTNVVRLRAALEPQDALGREQRVYYHPGVGTDGSLLQRVAGGAYGQGLAQNIESAYGWLSQNYEAGDDIYLFGFSRGAFTVRSLSGLIRHAGLPKGMRLPSDAHWKFVKEAYASYRTQKPFRPSAEVSHDPHVSVAFVGVWDTVGSLGIPDDMALLNELDDPDSWRFHDTRLGAHVRCARHAVAMDERRASFTATLWTDEHGLPLEDERVRQVWFPGVHCDVGGGYAECGLSDAALRWMIDEVQSFSEKAGAKVLFREGALAQIRPDAHGVRHDSLEGAFALLPVRPRAMPDVLSQPEMFHAVVHERRANPPLTDAPYFPTLELAVGEQREVEVFARQRWNRSGIYLKAGGVYSFEARGTWLDGGTVTGPDGLSWKDEDFGHHVGDWIGTIESAFRSMVGNSKAKFKGTRRHPYFPWFALLGAIANDGLLEAMEHDGSPGEHQTFLIGHKRELKVTKPGYLYAFGNDAWDFYSNNRGSLVLTVRRIS
jgi:Uncharacterized alpha/beta hydrolase domain (DUF2235)